MSQKTTTILYWIATGVFAAFMLMSGVMELMPVTDPAAIAAMQQMGYPDHFWTLLGVAKILGAFALLLPVFPTLKEWAYAGFTFDLIGAIVAIVASGLGYLGALLPLVCLLIMFVSYVLWKKRSTINTTSFSPTL